MVLAGIVCALVLSGAPRVAGAVADRSAIDGVWQTEPRDNGAYITIRIGVCPGADAQRCGQIVGAHAGARPDIVGDAILRDLKPGEAENWVGGEIIRPGEGTVYRSEVEVIGPDQIRVRGCVAGGLICGGQTWTRVR